MVKMLTTVTRRRCLQRWMFECNRTGGVRPIGCKNERIFYDAIDKRNARKTRVLGGERHVWTATQKGWRNAVDNAGKRRNELRSSGPSL